MCCRSDFNSVSAHLPCHLSMVPLKRDFFDIYLTTFCGVRMLKNTSAMRVIFFLKSSKLSLNFENAKRNCEKKIIFDITVSEDVAINCL